MLAARVIALDAAAGRALGADDEAAFAADQERARVGRARARPRARIAHLGERPVAAGAFALGRAPAGAAAGGAAELAAETEQRLGGSRALAALVARVALARAACSDEEERDDEERSSSRHEP